MVAAACRAAAGVAQIEDDAADVGFVRHGLRQHLHHHRLGLLEQAGGGGFDLVLGGDDDGLGRGDAIGGQHRLGLGFGEQRPAVGGGAGDHRFGGLLVDGKFGVAGRGALQDRA